MSLDRRNLLALAAVAPSAAAARGRSDPIDAYVAQRMKTKGIPGAVLAITRQGRTVKLKAYGLAEIETNRSMTTASVLPMASASKMLAGLSAMLLVEAGKLDVEAPAAVYLPELKANHPEVLVCQLLSHTSGLVGPGGAPGWSAEADRRKDSGLFADPRHLEYFTKAEEIAAAAPLPAKEPAGSKWRYNQYPYLLIAEIVERLTGEVYDAFVQHRILDRLGMKATAFGDHRTVIPNKRSTNYTREFGPLQNFALDYSPSYWPAAGCNTSGADAVKLMSAFRPGVLVRRESLERLWRPSPTATGVAQYGLGFDLEKLGERRWVGHEGGGCCYIGWQPETELGVALMLNLSGSKEDGVDREIAKRVLA